MSVAPEVVPFWSIHQNCINIGGSIVSNPDVIGTRLSKSRCHPDKISSEGSGIFGIRPYLLLMPRVKEVSKEAGKLVKKFDLQRPTA